MPFVVRTLTILFRDAGPLQDAEVCSQMEQVARFAATETPDPLLATRVNHVQHALDPDFQHDLRHAVKVLSAVYKRQVVDCVYALRHTFNTRRVAHVAND